MNCPRCKAQVSSTDLNCSSCGLKINIKCPRCNNLNKIGHPTCSKCGFVFVKFCPECNSANYASAKQCRRCFYKFETEENPPKADIPMQKKETPKGETDNSLFVFVDFISLASIYAKYKDESFKEKVVLNIKNCSKSAFSDMGEFINSFVVKIPYAYNPQVGFLESVRIFSEGMNNFNKLLKETLGCEVKFKFAITTQKERENAKDMPPQLLYGEENDIITSNNSYNALNRELPLVRISPDSYKAIFKKQKSPNTQLQTLNSQTAIETVCDALINKNEIRAISLSAPKGSGKTFLLTQLAAKFGENPPLLLYGQCSALTQISPIGLFSDIFISLFGLNFAMADFEENSRELKNLILRELTLINPQSADILINLLYPTQTSYYEEILINKKNTFAALLDIFKNLKSSRETVVIIDDFDLIDSASYEFLMFLIKNDYFTSGAKLLITYKDHRPLQGYLHDEKLPQSASLDVYLKDEEDSKIDAFIQYQYGSKEILPSKIKDQINVNSQGDLVYIEQVLQHLYEKNVVTFQDGVFKLDELKEDYYIPKDLGAILKSRLKLLKEKFEAQYSLLAVASFLGTKFNFELIRLSLELEQEEFETLVKALLQRGYITIINGQTGAFKNDTVWSYIYEAVKKDEDIKPLNQKTLNVLSGLTVSASCIKALLAESIDEKGFAFEIWTKTMKLASYIGDVGLYILAQKQCLLLLEEIHPENEQKIRNNIYERLGKIIYTKSPSEAIEYLSNAIVASQKEFNENKTIELSGYLVNACYRTGNYPGVVETTDLILSMFADTKEFALQRALIKSRKLKALLFLGNCEEIVNLVNLEINPVLQGFLKKPKFIRFADFSSIYEDWLSANITLANALAYQGNPLVFSLVEDLEKEIFSDKNKDLNSKFKINLGLTTALAYSIKGYVKISDDILQTIVKDFSYIMQDGMLVSKWNLINILNKIFKHDYENIKNDLFEAVTFANNTGDNYTKNILKTLLAKVILDEGNGLKSLEICSEQIAYFSKEKMAQGALLTWYITAKATAKAQSYDKANEICDKALEVCQSTKINNEYFKIMFQRLNAVCYLFKGDIESAKMYVEQAQELAAANELTYLEMTLYRLYANCIQASIVSLPDDKKSETAKNALTIYERALAIAEKLSLENSKSAIRKDITAFKAYCQLNRIEH